MNTRFRAVLGNVLEHYDQALYGLLAPSLAPQFFPFEDPVYSLLAAYALFPLGFIAKPLGAFIFGRLGDRWGHERALLFALFGMALATFAMGCLPTYAQAGVWAPILLALCRMLQGFFGKAQKTGGAIAILDGVEGKKQSLASSLYDASGMIGIALASGASAIFIAQEEAWRWLFWVGAIIGCLGWKKPEKKGVSQKPAASSSVLWTHRYEISVIACVSGFSYANYYLLSTFLNGFLPLVSSIQLREALAMNTWLLILDFLLLPLFGWLAKNWEFWIRSSLLGAILFSVPLYMLLANATLWQAGTVRVALMVMGVALAAPYHVWALSIAPKEHRYLIAAVGSAIGSKLIGAPAPAIALFLFKQYGWVWAPAIPLIVSSAIALYLLQKKPRAVLEIS